MVKDIPDGSILLGYLRSIRKRACLRCRISSMVIMLTRDARHGSIKSYSGATMRQILKIGRLEDDPLVIAFTLPL